AAESFALDGGEDFELLFSADPDSVESILDPMKSRFGISITRIGRTLEGEGLTVLSDPGEVEFRHFG
ncbi:MAG: thiamine-phosphate kinase, partial [Planctomycetota bacterium]